MSSNEVAAALTEAGFDLLHWLDIADYNTFCRDHDTLQPVPTFQRPHRLALLVGNTRSLWPTFIEVLHRRSDLQQSPDPFDRFVQERIEAAVGDTPCVRRYAHDRGEGLVSMLHLASICGFAELGPAHLAVHRVFGPWFALRALLVFDEAPAVVDLPSAGSCKGCAAPCADALSAALSEEDAPWSAWVAVRTVCPIGQIYRYGAQQLRYHYTKDRSIL